VIDYEVNVRVWVDVYKFGFINDRKTIHM